MKLNGPSLSIAEARATAVRAQGFGPVAPRGPAEMLEQLGAVQLDTISVLARSHELVAYARLGGVPRKDVEAAYWAEPACAFEYFAHANCVIPIDMWPAYAFRRRAHRDRAGSKLASPAANEVRARLRDGPITTRDIGGARSGTAGWWNWSEAKIAVELLWRSGEVVCTNRRSWQRVYSLAERSIPERLLAQDLDDPACFNILIERAARALGVATMTDLMEHNMLGKWAPGGAARARRMARDAIEAAGLLPVTVEGWSEQAWIHPSAWPPASAVEHQPVLLSPFDTLLWDRRRAWRLFGVRFKLEAYTPKEERVDGYFVTPLMVNGSMVGRADPVRRRSVVTAAKVTVDEEKYAPEMARALWAAAGWVGCTAVEVGRVTPESANGMLERELESSSVTFVTE